MNILYVFFYQKGHQDLQIILSETIYIKTHIPYIRLRYSLPLAIYYILQLPVSLKLYFYC